MKIKDIEKIIVSKAVPGPLVVSEDLKRCMKYFDIKQYPSVMRELGWLKQKYPSELLLHLQNSQFIHSEYLDIVWTYFDISDSWARNNYFLKKASYLKALKDSLCVLNLYHHYDTLEPFQLLDSLVGITAESKNRAEISPLSWVNNVPVTKLQQQIESEAVATFNKLPPKFGCCGYNFTKESAPVMFNSECFLSSYNDALFPFTEQGILLSAKNIHLFDYRKLEREHKPVLTQKGDVDKLCVDMRSQIEKLGSEAVASITPTQLLHSVFLQTQPDKLNPLAGRSNVIELFKSKE